jgi:hypothetical protein
MPKLKKPARDSITTEATAYLSGVFREFHKQSDRYNQLTAQLLSQEAQIELAEKTLCLTRDHLAMMIEKTEGAKPNDWSKVLREVRFVGVRLADACGVLLQEHKRLTPEQILGGLNDGMFRFRTNSPLREIHAALLRQSFAKKVGTSYVWVGSAEQQMPLRLRLMKGPMIDQNVAKEGTTNSAQGDEK